VKLGHYPNLKFDIWTIVGVAGSYAPKVKKKQHLSRIVIGFAPG